MFPSNPTTAGRWRLQVAAVALLFTQMPAIAQDQPATQATPPAARALVSLTPAEIETAEYAGGDLPAGQSALTAKVQVLLDRSGVSPGVVDGWRGGMSESAIKAFQRRAGLPMTGRMDHAVWDLLHGFAASPLVSDYTITPDDATGLVDNIPSDYAQKAAMTSQGYTSILEKLAERFHMDEKFLAKLNPGAAFQPGETIHVTLPAKPIRAKVARIIVDKQTRRVAAYDANGRMVADYPATVGSSDTPSPHGHHVVDAVALNPTYTYNPKRNFKQGENDRVLIVPPGPNGPVGNVWIDLSEPTYGIHGTATPSQLFLNQSHGCVRLTNWDAWELAHMVQSGVTTVEFLDPGVSIADVTQGAAPAAAAVQTASATVVGATRPPARGDRLPPAVTAETPAATAAATVPAATLPSAEPAPPEAIATTTGAVATTVPAAVTTQSALEPAPSPETSTPEEPEYPSDVPLPQSMSETLPDTLPGQASGSVTLYPQPAQP